MQLIDALERVAQLAASLTSAEHRILHSFLIQAFRDQSYITSISSRELCRQTGLARSNVIAGLHGLVRRGLILSDQGSAVRAATYQLLFLERSALLSFGPAVGSSSYHQRRVKPLHSHFHKGGLDAGPHVENIPEVVLSQDHIRSFGGPVMNPPLKQESDTCEDRTKERARVDSIDRSTEVIDRVLKADPKQTDPELMAHFRQALHSYVVKWGRAVPSHPPDDRLVAEFLACAEPPVLETLLYDLMAERKQPGHSYAWFVTVALQRTYGIAPDQYKARRAYWRSVPTKPATRETATTADLKQKVARLTTHKAMR